MSRTLRTKLIATTARARLWTRRRIPPGFRWPAGLLLMVAGVFGILPILGFWMIPLGIALVAMDLGDIRRWWIRRKNRRRRLQGEHDRSGGPGV
ncbi:MAG: hypothetical protein EX266_10565 [Rhodobacteraceae bacterium]|nr:MAG: hypothetical protein EX266_10565 [Paracoccaceae bacterium]